MKKILFSGFALLFLAVAFGQDIPASLDKLVSVYAAQNKFNGTVLVASKGKILLEKGYGLRSVTDSARHRPQSIFMIGSVTKQITAALILKLQEQGKLSVTDKLNKYFPDYPRGNEISIEHLLHHTSGIFSYTSDDAFMESQISIPHDRKAMMALFQNKPLEFEPGTKWDYSNSAYSLLGYIIEDASGMDYYAAMRKYILQPAGMVNSGFDFTHLKSPYKSTGYFNLTERGSTPAPIVDSSVSYSAGAIYSTVGDLYKWNQAIWNNKIINKKSTEQGFRPNLNHYGYGIFIDSMDGKRRVEHSGGIHGFLSNMASIPEDQTCVILLSNAGTSFLDTITKSLLAIVYNKPYTLPEIPPSYSLTTEQLKPYTGKYNAEQLLVINIWVEDGKLMGQPEGQQKLQLHPEKEDLFYLREVDARVRFDRNEKKEIIAMVLLQGGREIRAVRE